MRKSDMHTWVFYLKLLYRSTKNENLTKINVDIGMKKAQKQEIIQDEKEIWSSLPIPTFHTVAHVHVIMMHDHIDRHAPAGQPVPV